MQVKQKDNGGSTNINKFILWKNWWNVQSSDKTDEEKKDNLETEHYQGYNKG